MHGISENNKIPRFEIVAIVDYALQESRIKNGADNIIGNSELKNSLMQSEYNGAPVDGS